jgi:hypothetical protein
MNTLSPLIDEANRVIVEAIKHFSLTVPAEKILVTIQSKGRKNAVGWFWHGRWNKTKKSQFHEINMSAEHLTTHNMGELLLHELAHAENDHKEIKDCCGRRHNKKFKVMAEALGLVVLDPDKSVGYGYTDLGDGAKTFLAKIAFKRELFELCRITPGPKAPKPGSRMLKCVCPACGYTVRTTQKWLDVGVPTCACGEEMESAT